MARLNQTDSIEFGFLQTSTPPIESHSPFAIDAVWEAAATVYDPEIPVDIVELGLLYRVDAEELASGGWRIEIDMSVTAPFCGVGDIRSARTGNDVTNPSTDGNTDVADRFHEPRFEELSVTRGPTCPQTLRRRVDDEP